jgi:hypothetical protein
MCVAPMCYLSEVQCKLAGEARCTGKERREISRTTALALDASRESMSASRRLAVSSFLAVYATIATSRRNRRSSSKESRLAAKGYEVKTRKFKGRSQSGRLSSPPDSTVCIFCSEKKPKMKIVQLRDSNRKWPACAECRQRTTASGDGRSDSWLGCHTVVVLDLTMAEPWRATASLTGVPANDGTRHGVLENTTLAASNARSSVMVMSAE